MCRSYRRCSRRSSPIPRRGPRGVLSAGGAVTTQGGGSRRAGTGATARQASAGAVVRFDGVVRDHNEGRAVTLLEYEAYGSMAVAEMERIGEEIERELPGVRVAAHHRVGALVVGDVAVVCVASAVHRGDAFE